MKLSIVLNILSYACGFFGCYLSLRSIMVLQIRNKIAGMVFNFKSWNDTPLYYRIIFRFFRITNKNWDIFFHIESTLEEKNKKLIQKLRYDFWEPFWALGWFFLSFALAITSLFL